MSKQIEVKIKLYVRIVAYFMGPVFMLGPIAIAVYMAVFDSPVQSAWLFYLFLPFLSLFFIYIMIDSISEVTVNQNIITWRYLFLPKVCTVPLNCLTNIKPYYEAKGGRSGYKYEFNNRTSFGIVDSDMINAEALFEYLSQNLKNSNNRAAGDASRP